MIIALPLHLHAPAAIAAMKAGLHVMTEKLMGHSVHECKEMARVAEQTELLLATGHQRHYNILYDNAVDMIRKGLLGELHYIRAQWHRGNLPGNDSWQQPMPRAAKPDDPQADVLDKNLRDWTKKLDQLKKENNKTAADWEKTSRPGRGPDRRRRGRREEVRLRGFGTQGRRGQGDLRPAGHRGTDPLAAVGSHRRRTDGRIGQPSARRGEHLHRRGARRAEADAA